MEQALEKIQAITIVIFMVGNLLEVGLSLNVAEALAALRNARFVVLTFLWCFILGPALAVLLTKIIPLAEPFALGLVPKTDVRGVGLPDSMMTEPGLHATLRPEFDLPLVTATGPLAEVSVLPPQVELSEFKLGPRFSGEPNGASKLDWSVLTETVPDKQGEILQRKRNT